MNVLLTGGNGFVGSYCAALLNHHGHHVHAPTSTELDISKPFKLPGHVDCVIHLAAYNITSVGIQDPALFNAINVQGTRHVMEGVSADHVVFLSTLKVHDPVKGLYAQSKMDAEEVLRQYQGKRSVTIVRSANILGLGQAPKAVLPVFVSAAKHNEDLNLSANPLTPISYIDVLDIAEALMRCLKLRGISSVYNVAYPNPVTLMELASKVIAACGSSSKIRSTVPPTPLPYLAPDCQQTWAELKFKPRFCIDEIINSVIQGYEQTP